MAVMTGERRVVSVLFADIVNSTGIGERLGPERSKFLFDEVARLMGAQVERYGGTVAQQIGDEVYAVFGAPLSHEDDSERAVRAALAIQRALGQYSEEVEAAYGVELSARVGINTGPVVINMESDDPYNALGDTVNVASRIQELAGPGGIVVGQETHLQVESCFELEELPEQELRGKSGPVRTYRVLGALEHAPLLPTRPLVGRDFELTVVERAMDGLVEGRGAIVSIMGEAGIGKTRLVAEVQKDYRDRVRFLEGRAVSYAQTFPYWPVRELLREWLEVGASTPEARVRLELKAILADTMGDQAADAYPFLAGLVGLTLEPDAAARIRDLNRESLQHQTFEVFADLVSRLAEERPLCLVFEDLHWADESTLGLLESLLGVTEEASVALFLLYRTEREHGSWHLGERSRQRYPHRYREIELRPLPLDASRALAGAVAEGDFHESMNLAALWRLPVLFCCENNLYAMGTALERSESQTDLCIKAASYGRPAMKVDGQDIVAVLDATRRAQAQVREGEGPLFVEYQTYRFRAHSMFDPELYRDKREVEAWKTRGPLHTYTARLKAQGMLTEEQFLALDARVNGEVQAAVDYAERGTWEPVEDLALDVHTVESKS